MGYRSFHNENLPLVVEAPLDGLDILAWLNDKKEWFDKQLSCHGAILFRDFNSLTAKKLEEVVNLTSGQAFNNIEESSPRSKVDGNVYTSTDYSAEQSIFPHNENSYMKDFPLRLYFYFDLASQQGGETPIADCRKVYKRIRPEIIEKFIEKKWMYVRNYGSGIGMSWEEAFKTNDKQAVEKYCTDSDIEFEWDASGGLKTRQIREAVLRHPETGEISWFNHLTFFHISTLSKEYREGLLSIFDEKDLPNNTYYGDGTSIEEEVVEEIREAYLAELTSFSWKNGDFIVVDNLLTAHARNSFVGERRIMLAQAKLISRDGLAVERVSNEL